ncbi:MAG TPA: PDZ domain-containing protein [Herpetosiphonaceae bacterium]
MASWAERYGSYWRAAGGWIRGGFVVLAVASAVLFFRYGAAAAPDPQAEEEAGVLVTSVVADTPAARAGIKRGDIVLEIDGQPANEVMELHKYVLGKESGDQVRLKVRHGDEIRELTIALGDRKGEAYLGIVPFLEQPWGIAATASAVGGEHSFAFAAPWAGDATMPLTGGLSIEALPALDGFPLNGEAFTATLSVEGIPGEAGVFAFRSGDALSETMLFKAGDGPEMRIFANEVPVGGVDPESPAGKAGLAPGDIITAVNGAKLESPLDLREALAAAKPGDALELTVRNSAGEEREVSVTLGEHPNQPGEAYLGLFDDFHWAAPTLRPGIGGLMRSAIGAGEGGAVQVMEDWEPFQI